MAAAKAANPPRPRIPTSLKLGGGALGLALVAGLVALGAHFADRGGADEVDEAEVDALVAQIEEDPAGALQAMAANPEIALAALQQHQNDFIAIGSGIWEGQRVASNSVLVALDIAGPGARTSLDEAPTLGSAIATSVRSSAIGVGASLPVPYLAVVEPGDQGSIQRHLGVSDEDYAAWNSPPHPQGHVVWRFDPSRPPQSRGMPHRGSLVNGIPLRSLPDDPWCVRRASLDERSGNMTLISALVRAFSRTDERYPHRPPPEIWDIAYPHGGQNGQHRSHQTGRDVDIAYFARTDARDHLRVNNCDERNGVIRPPAAHPHPACAANDGQPWANWDSACGGELSRFMDVERQWYFTRSVIAGGTASWMWLDQDLYSCMQAYANECETNRAVYERAFRGSSRCTGGARPGDGVVVCDRDHKSHFHIRFRCDETDTACEQAEIESRTSNEVIEIGAELDDADDEGPPMGVNPYGAPGGAANTAPGANVPGSPATAPPTPALPPGLPATPAGVQPPTGAGNSVPPGTPAPAGDCQAEMVQNRVDPELFDWCCDDANRSSQLWMVRCGPP